MLREKRVLETTRVLDKTACWRLNMLKTLGSWTWIMNIGGWCPLIFCLVEILTFRFHLGWVYQPVAAVTTLDGACLFDGAWFYVTQTSCFSGVEIVPHRVECSLYIGILWKGHYVAVDCGSHSLRSSFFYQISKPCGVPQSLGHEEID